MYLKVTSHRLCIIIGLVLFLSSLNLTSFEPEKKVSKGAYGGVLVLAVTSDPKSFNPIIAKESNTSTITDILYSGLLQYDPMKQVLSPNIANKWSISDDGLEYRFFLSNNLKWSDGYPLTAHDVTFTFNHLILNPKVKTPERDYFKFQGKSIQAFAANDYEVVFKLPYQLAPFLRLCQFAIIPKHIFKDTIATHDFNHMLTLSTPPNEMVVNGPFQLESYTPGKMIQLKKNIYYHGTNSFNDRLPYLDRIKIHITKNQDLAFRKFYVGETDIYGLGGNDMRSEDYPILKKLADRTKQYTVVETLPDYSTQFLVFNQNKHKGNLPPYKLKWFQSTAFRQAIAHAIDRKKITSKIFQNLAVIQDGPMTPSSGYFFNKDVTHYTHDPQAALKILGDNGFKYNKKRNILFDSAGNRVEIDMVTNANNTNRVKISAIIRESLDAIGIEINFTPLQYFNQLISRLETSNWEAILVGLTGEEEPHLLKDVWSLTGSLHFWKPNAVKDATPWEKRIHDIFEIGAKEMDRTKRKLLYNEWQYLVSKHVPLIYTVVPIYIAAKKNTVKNFFPLPNERNNALHNIAEIYKEIP